MPFGGNFAPSRDASVVTARPVTAGPIAKYSPPDALTSGYQLDPTAYGGPYVSVPTISWYRTPVLTAGSNLTKSQVGAPWPTQIDSGIKRWTSYRPNNYRQIFAMKVRGNYGANTSRANFAFRHQWFPASDTYHGGQAGYPGPVPSALRPMWNNVLAIVWSLRVINPTAGGSLNNTTTPSNSNSQNYANPSEFVPGGTASLVYKGENVS